MGARIWHWPNGRAKKLICLYNESTSNFQWCLMTWNKHKVLYNSSSIYKPSHKLVRWKKTLVGNDVPLYLIAWLVRKPKASSKASLTLGASTSLLRYVSSIKNYKRSPWRASFRSQNKRDKACLENWSILRIIRGVEDFYLKLLRASDHNTCSYDIISL